MQQNLPRHVAVIPDGNRRWAKSYGLPSWRGHREGRKRFREISQVAFDLGIPYFTFWAMSEDNHKKRGANEIKFLISLLLEELKSGRTKQELLKNKTRFRVLGKWKTLFPNVGLEHIINKLENQTQLFDKHHLTILVGYDGTTELVETIQSNLYLWFLKTTREPSQSLDFETIRRASWAGELPLVDLIIRTGETREDWSHNSSGFMMLHTPNSETRYSKILWPDFTKQEFEKIIEEYGQRERKFGK